MEPDPYIPNAACVAVMVEEPIPTIVTVLPEMVATEGLLLVYVNSPPLLDTGGVILKEWEVYLSYQYQFQLL